MGTTRLKRFDEMLHRDLQDPEFAAAYLEDALSESLDEFLVALRKYVQATSKMTQVAREAQVTREALYRMLSEQGNPGIRQLNAVLQANGLCFSLRPYDRAEEEAKPQAVATM